MGRSLGTSSTTEESNALLSLLARVPNRLLLLIGDSSLRNQFIQLSRIGLAFERETPVAYGVVHSIHSGTFLTPFPIRQDEKPDSSNGFWGGFPWLLASTNSSTTLLYAKVWGCSTLSPVLRKMKNIMRAQRSVHSNLAPWPPYAVLWNFGLHLLHVYPSRPVPTTSLLCALKYERLVRKSWSELRASVPNSRLIWRTTNAVCDSSFQGPWATASRAYHCSGLSCGEERVKRVRELCSVGIEGGG
ncbi:MAG: hypothetical protein SGPRY_001848 [Prymnesium sp.]